MNLARFDGQIHTFEDLLVLFLQLHVQVFNFQHILFVLFLSFAGQGFCINLMIHIRRSGGMGCGVTCQCAMRPVISGGPRMSSTL